MTNLPSSWEIVRLDEIAEVRLGRQRSPKNHAGDNMRPYLRAANVDWNGLKLDDIKEMHFSETEVGTYRLEPGDLVLSEASGSPGEVGKPALWDGEIENCCIQNTLIRVRPVGVDPKYLLHFFRYEALRGAFGKGARGVGIHHLGAAKLAQWQLPIPPLVEQHRIVETLEDHLSRLDVGNAGLTKSGRRSTRLWSSILDAVCSGELIGRRFDGQELPLAEVASVQGGIQKQQKRRPIKNRFPFLRVANVPRGNLDLHEVHEVELFNDELDRFRLHFGDLLVVEGNGSPDQIGRAAMWNDAIPDCVHQNHLIRVRPGEALDPHFLELTWNAPKVVDQIRRVASSTSGLHTLSTAKVKSVRIPVPDLDVQVQLVTEAKRWRSHLDAAEQSISEGYRRSRALRISLLAEAFEGRLVIQDPNDDPASVLLERITAERVATQSLRRRKSRTGKTTEECRTGSKVDTSLVVDIPAPSPMTLKSTPVQETLL